MREYLTPDDICNQIMMNRSLFKGMIVIAEGNTDQRLYGKFMDPKEARIIPAHSKSNVISVVNRMSARRDGKLLGIIDRDLDDLKGRLQSAPLFYTDFRDLEMMILNSDALSDVLAEYGDTDRIERFVHQNGRVLDAIVASAYPLGLLMYVSHLRGYNLNFKNLDFRDFIDRRTLRMDVMRMVQSVIENTLGCELNRKNVHRDLMNQEPNHPDKMMIARGHDAVNILLIGLKESFGGYNSFNLNANGLGGALRIAYSADNFKSTSLYKETLKWSENRGRIWKLTGNRGPASSLRPKSP